MADAIDHEDAITYLQHVDKHNIQNDSDFLLGHLPLQDSKCLLDVGYGSGQLLSKVLNAPYRLEAYGVEKSEALYEHSMQLFENKNIQLICTDFMDWQTDVRFDVITMSFYLHHVDFSRHLTKALSLLDEGGVVIILDRIAMDEAAKREFRGYWEEYYAAQHEWYEDCPAIYTREEVDRVVRAAGFITGKFIPVPNDRRKGTENFPKTLVVVKRGETVL
ncbi:class I SAM-dependent methyltransferase [Neobacillus sp. Marseille-QA0830]